MEDVNQNNALRVVEFFSGIGGWRCALESSSITNYSIVSAFDVSPMANEVYLHNFKESPSAKSIDSLTVSQLDGYQADMWVMSPPCQPFTINNKTDHRDAADARSKAFLHLTSALQRMENPPRYIVLENVCGFEGSECCQKFLEVLRGREYGYMQFHLTPLQYGIPNRRPRYFCVASRQLPGNPSRDGLLSAPDASLHTSLPGEETVIGGEALRTIGDYLDSDPDIESLMVPSSVMNKPSAWCFDIVSPSDSSSSCFTKGYSRFIRGTGSVLLMKDNNVSENLQGSTVDTVGSVLPTSTAKCCDDEPLCKRAKPSPSTLTLSSCHEDDTSTANKGEKECEAENVESPQWTVEQIRRLSLRYFSPSELLRLFGFNSLLTSTDSSNSFSFPPSVSRRKQYELIGNSINITVASRLLSFLDTQTS